MVSKESPEYFRLAFAAGLWTSLCASLENGSALLSCSSVWERPVLLMSVFSHSDEDKKAQLCVGPRKGSNGSREPVYIEFAGRQDEEFCNYSAQN